MIERGDGRILNVSSGAADTRSPGGVQQLPYSASKAGLDALSYGLANQLVGTGVAVNVLAPSVFTEAVAFSVTDPDMLRDMRAHMTSPEAYGEAMAKVAEQPAGVHRPLSGQPGSDRPRSPGRPLTSVTGPL